MLGAMSFRIALATCRVLPEPDRDEAALLGALAREGAEVRLLPWDGDAPLPSPRELDLVVVRSTWNYAKLLEKFVSWLGALALRAPVENPVAILRRNVDKVYLRALADGGVPIVPTAFVDRGRGRGLARVAEELGARDLVVKPRVSAGSWKTRRFEQVDGEAEAFFAALAEERDVIVQPYLASVEDRGERSIVVLDGAVSHAIRKSPRFSGEAESVRRVDVDDDERAFAAAVLAPFGSLLYARVDVARDAAGGLVLMELELLEPSLFFHEAPEALAPFARAIVRRASEHRPR